MGSKKRTQPTLAELRYIKRKESPNFYEVEAKSIWKAPMVLVDYLCKAGRDSAISSAIIDEYWNSKFHWHILEFLSDEIKIVRVLETPDFTETAGANFLYSKDLDLAKQTNWEAIQIQQNI